MGIDYIINRSCPVKEEFGYEETFNMIKTKAQFDFLRQNIGQPEYPKLNTFSNIRFQILKDGQFDVKMATLKDIDHELAAFRKISWHCDACPANLAGCPGGCWGYIAYPIRPFVESFLIWTVEYLIDLEVNKPSGMLIKYVIENNLKSDVFKKLRKNGSVELNKPLEYSWGKMLNKKKVDTGQILEMLFGFQVDSGSALVISSFLKRCQEIFPQWFNSFVQIVLEKNPQLTFHEVSKEIKQTLNPYFQYGDACFYAFNQKENLIVLP